MPRGAIAIVGLFAASACDGSAGVADGAGIDPRGFDCRSLGADGKHLPERVSAVPTACVLDNACGKVLVSAHRGAGGQLGRIAPEDTLAAYRAAIALGVEIVETDPRPTKDGVLVNLHDSTVDRTTDGSGEVDQLGFDEIRALAIDPGRLEGDFGCEKVPTLTEVLATCRGRAVVLVDANKSDRVDLMVQAVLDADALDWAVFDTDSLDKIDRALALEPRLRFMIRPRAVAEIEAQVDHFAPSAPSFVELGAAGDRTDGALIVHRRGLRVLSDVFAEDINATIVGDMSGYGAAIEAGVDVLQTDRPELVLEVLRARGLR